MIITPELEAMARAMARPHAQDALRSRKLRERPHAGPLTEADLAPEIDRTWGRFVQSAVLGLTMIRDATAEMNRHGESVECGASAGWSRMVDYVVGSYWLGDGT